MLCVQDSMEVQVEGQRQKQARATKRLEKAQRELRY